jgi:hypothetical protein
MNSDLNTRKFAHRTNIDRYRKILATYLTAEERSFVERRISEEQAALQQLAGRAPPDHKPSFAA